MTRPFALVAGVVVALCAGCGVTSQDRPQPIDETTIQQPPAIPSVDTETGPTPTDPPSSTTTSPARSESPPPSR